MSNWYVADAMNVSPRFGRIAGLVVALGAALFASRAEAVGTRVFTLDSLDDLRGGNLAGVSVDSSGRVRAGLSYGSMRIADAASVWSSVLLSDGSVLLGTGSEGKVFRVKDGAVSLVASTGELGVSSLVIAWNGDILAGTFPNGRIYKIDPAGKGDKPALFAAFPGVEHVWALAYDEKGSALYAATGPDGKLFRVNSLGAAELYFDSDEPHLVSLALGDGGVVYAGSSGKALLYKLSAPGRASVLHDFDADDVKAIAVAPPARGGAIWAIANKYGEAPAPAKRAKSSAPSPQPTKPSHPGKGELVRIGSDGVVETMLDDDETHFVSLGLGDDGAPFVGTGAEGRVYTVDDDHVVRLVADTDERQVGVLVMAGSHRFMATTDPAVLHEVTGTGGPDAIWTSKVLDAGLRATFGQLRFRADGAVELSTRSGNAAAPDASWSAWSRDVEAAADVTSPPGRFLQVRARFRRDPAAVLHDVSIAFVTDNARAIVTSIDATPKGQTRAPTKPGIGPSGGPFAKPNPTIKLSWKVENPDQDELRYRLTYRPEGAAAWRPLLKPSEKLTRTEYEWETSDLPEGVYRVRVEASDELANPPDRSRSHALESRAILVDATPPVFRSLVLDGRRLRGEVVDGLGPIARVEVTVAGTDEWRPLAPIDGIFDEATEIFDADISSIAPPGAAIVAVRAYDAAGNAVTRDVAAR